MGCGVLRKAIGESANGPGVIGDKETIERDLGRISGVDGRNPSSTFRETSGEPSSWSILSKDKKATP